MSMNHPGTTGVALAALLLLAGGCASRGDDRARDRSGLFEPHRIDLPQGNYVTREMLAQVRPGMSREQVRAVLGAPLLQAIFRADRADYVFRYQRPSGQFELRRVVVRYQDDRVTGVEADDLPAREDPSDPALPGYRPAPKAATAPAAGAPPAASDKAASDNAGTGKEGMK